VVEVAGSCGRLKSPAARTDFVEGTSATTTAARSSRKSAKCVEKVGAYMAGEPRACDGHTLMHTPCRYGTRYMFFRSADVSQMHSRCLRHLRSHALKPSVTLYSICILEATGYMIVTVQSGQGDEK